LAGRPGGILMIWPAIRSRLSATMSCNLRCPVRLSTSRPTSATVQMLKLHTAVTQNRGDSPKSRHATSRSHVGRKYVIILQR